MNDDFFIEFHDFYNFIGYMLVADIDFWINGYFLGIDAERS
jgi:hypothetical protein